MNYSLMAFIFLMITCTIVYEINIKEIEEFYDKSEIAAKIYNKNEKIVRPKVEIILPVQNEEYTWGSQVRYSINVEDETDGESRYNEINPYEVFFEIEYIPYTQALKIRNEETIKVNSNNGLAILGRSSCFGCHADKDSMVGPSFSEIAGRYKDENDINKKKSVSNNIINGTVGIWGEIVMTSYPDISETDALAIVDYIFKQGAKKNAWVYPGLEGVFRVIDQPDNNSSGYYLLTASYTSSTQKRGQDSIVLTITN